MNTKRLAVYILFVCIAGLSRSAASPLPPQVSVGIGFGHVGFFYDDLRPYGDWIELESGFYAWRPIHMHAGWRPYYHGRWIWTNHGWYWHSSEPFGWIVFHYGRWYYDDYYGWIWIPDDVWGPGWVEWRYHDDYIGWAPLPPYATFRFHLGISFSTAWAAPVHYWSFIRYRHFGASDAGRYVVGENYARRLIRTSRSVRRYEMEHDRVINRGVDRGIIERRGRIRVEDGDVRDGTTRSERLIREGGRQRIEIYRPSQSEVGQRPERIEARRPERSTTLDLRSVERSRTREQIGREPERVPDRTAPGVDQRPAGRDQAPSLQEKTDRRESTERRPQESWRVRPQPERSDRARQAPAARPRQNTDRNERSATQSRSGSRVVPERSSRERQSAPAARQQPSRQAPSPQQPSRRDGNRQRRDQ